MTATHDQLLDLQVFLAATPVQQAGLSTPLLIFNDATALGADIFRAYGSPSEAEDDADLSAVAKLAAAAAFAQNPQPAQIWIADVKATDTLTETLDKVLDEGLFVVAVTTPDLRVSGTQATFAASCAARQIHYTFQSSDAGWLTSGVPAAFSATASLEYVSGIYHPTDAELDDVRWQVKNLVANPDRTSRNWTGVIAGSAPFSVSATQYNFLTENNINFAAPFGPATTYVAPGRMLNGRPASEIMTAQWFRKRLLERWTRVFLQYDAAAEKLPVDADGQGILEGEVNAQANIGISAGHFTPGQVLVTLPEVTSGDRDAQRIPIEVAIMTRTGAIKISSAVTLSRDPVITTED